MKADGRGTATPMMVVFAGPNGSGKSTINREFLNNPNSGFKGEYINADDIAKSLERDIPDYRDVPQGSQYRRYGDRLPHAEISYEDRAMQ